MDSQAIAGGSGDQTTGPFKIVDNFLESSGECILFGGSAATITPTDIEIRRNHLFKPMTWMKGQPGYIGGTGGNPFIVKNLFELKNAPAGLIRSEYSGKHVGRLLPSRCSQFCSTPRIKRMVAGTFAQYAR